MSIIDTLAQPLTSRFAPLPRTARMGLNGLILGLWLWLYRPVFNYLSVLFSREDFRTNQLALVGVVALIAIQMHKERVRPQLAAMPHLAWPGLGLALGGSMFYLAVERFLDVNTLSASLFGLASYGLLGLWMQPRRWRKGLPAALLHIGTLPFGHHMQTFIGYPMRIFTAAVVRDGLAATGVSSIGVDTILVFENGVSQVDLPCSGVKSLWTGMLFLTAATWVERRPLNLRWLLTALIFAGLLFGANLVRVGVLVVVGQVAGWQLAAQMLHIPLGVLGFVAACAAAVGLLRLQQPMGVDMPVAAQLAPAAPRSRPAWLGPALAVAILAMILGYAPRPETGLGQPPPAWKFPAELKTQPMPLNPDEIAWLTRDGADSADRHRFEWRGISGSMILITSNTWRAHHRPERCFEVYGLSLDDSRTHLVTPNFPVRLVALGNGQGHSLLTATYWFQSANRTTDDYATRIWADVAPQRKRWVLVSILFDNVHNPNNPDVQQFYTALRQSVARHLKGGPSS